MVETEKIKQIFIYVAYGCFTLNTILKDVLKNYNYNYNFIDYIFIVIIFIALKLVDNSGNVKTIIDNIHNENFNKLTSIITELENVSKNISSARRSVRNEPFDDEDIDIITTEEEIINSHRSININDNNNIPVKIRILK